ncbi:MAG: bifunctional folylpolyglutamate synthase/dihydrofolate synthase [Firmicutes bacterium]|nr:bifunctional folylpolyglutamate synthase/dihydrofolate synthase [Bacillota bacterium]
MTDSIKTAIDKIHEFQRFGSILGLERMTRLLEILGNPQEQLKVIHVAGTNGKGSVCRYIYNVLLTAGYKTGIYISPFIEEFNERIEINEKHIRDDELAYYTDKVLSAVKTMTEGGEQSPTEFEVITAVAFLYFKEQACDYVVLEVGLGGKGDSTNVCKKPLMTVITSISMDHTDRLGDTIEEIAAEKAGIIKDGCPVVTSAKDVRALRVIEDTASVHGSFFFETRNLPVNVKTESTAGSKFDVDIQGVMFENIEISMAGRHQIENAVTAICALNILEERGCVRISRKDLYEGLKAAGQPGRFEVFSVRSLSGKKHTVVIDGAHNFDGSKALADAAKDFFHGQKILMVTGILADKDIDGITGCFMDITKDFVVTEPDNPRKLNVSELAEILEKKGGSCIKAFDIKDAYDKAMLKRDEYDVTIYAGSLYMIGKVRTMLRKEKTYA